MNLRKKLFTMAALLGAVMGLSIAYGAITPAASAATQHRPTLNKCGPRAHTAKQWRSYATRNDTWAHVVGIVRKNASKYAFHPVDGDTIDRWYNRQVVVLRSARTQRIPNTGCTAAGEVRNIHDKVVPKNWPLAVTLPDALTKKDIHPTKTRYYNKQVVKRFYFLGQPSCINGASRAQKVWVVYFVHVKVKPKPHKPKPKKPVTTVTSVQPGSCNANNSPGAVVCSSFYVIVTCGNNTIQISGSTQKEAQDNAQNWMTQNCAQVPAPCNCTPPPVVIPPPVVVVPPPVVIPPPVVVPPAPSVKIDVTNINDIPEGKCRPVSITVDSTAAGAIVVAPSKGAINNDCYNTGTRQPSLTLSVSVGHNSYTVNVWAPQDANASSDTLTVTPVIAGVDANKNSVSTTYTISHPENTRP